MFKTPQSVKALLTTQAVVEIGLGMFPLFLPRLTAQRGGATLSEPEGVLLSMIAGVSLISMGWLSWVMRNSEQSTLQKLVLQMFALFQTLVFIVLLYGQLAQLRGVMGWVPVVIHGLFSVSFVLAVLNYKTGNAQSSINNN